MSVDPASIPDHVLDAANNANTREAQMLDNGDLFTVAIPVSRKAIAAALDTLMDDQPVKGLPILKMWDDSFWAIAAVRPSDVLGAVLARNQPVPWEHHTPTP